ncbi:MAG: PEP-CTERM sorting domain-containing protein [Phycisphaerales bacterium]|nr:MAG: PEP-CTERM sorting domain-containing protein [Phycisphaerales bacterium]
MRSLSLAMAIGAAFLIASPIALADWDPGDPYKMHFPQMPDMNGWDVNSTYYEGLADDWMCSESGFVRDFHIWGSWLGDVQDEINFIHSAIWSNDPVGDQGVPGEDPDNQWSKPLERLWHYDNQPGEFTVRYWGDGDQGWYNPLTGDVFESDHTGTWQYNFYFDEAEAFYQEQGEIYWLEISVRLPFDSTTKWGWKNSVDHFEDDAVWGHDEPYTIWEAELYEPPDFTQSLDLAFVITPEPTTLVLAALGGLALLRRRR